MVVGSGRLASLQSRSGASCFRFLFIHTTSVVLVPVYGYIGPGHGHQQSVRNSVTFTPDTMAEG